jgi:hypothetical protein
MLGHDFSILVFYFIFVTVFYFSAAKIFLLGPKGGRGGGGGAWASFTGLSPLLHSISHLHVLRLDVSKCDTSCGD